LELSATGQLSDKLMLMAAYTYQDSEVISAEGRHITQIGNPLARTPEHSASFWASYLFGDDWRAGLGAQYSSERYNSSDSISREVADGYTTVDMMVAYDFSENIRLQLNGSNLGDKRYINQLGGGHYIPGERRQFRLSGHYLF
jgi:catecholate siderophore receptor